jgi:hypothetical protein
MHRPEGDSTVVKYTLSTFNVLRKLSDFDEEYEETPEKEKEVTPSTSGPLVTLPLTGQQPIPGAKSESVVYHQIESFSDQISKYSMPYSRA